MTVIEPYVHWNGRVTPTEEARVSVLDTGYLYGDGIYETMRAYGGSAFALDRHLARLRRSGDAIGLRTLNEGDLRVRVTEVMEANGLADAVLRITLTRGQLEKRLDLSTCGEPSVLITAYPIDSAADTARRQGIRVVHSRFLRLTEFSLAGIKTTNYQVSLFARNEAREAGADEVLLANETGDIVEGAASNVFLVTEGELLTPPLGTGILGGITRETVLEI
ncbi:MAG: aminotransferase class IV, partial [Gemmatimonadota bacterium]|nr:aminotransferase class IV [Gemmatimonadota bacterium]